VHDYVLVAILAHTGDQIMALVGDGRPTGWTEALALSFISESYSYSLNSEDGPDELCNFATLFSDGVWDEIQEQYPNFQKWIDARP
jgi:hypothetical protein